MTIDELLDDKAIKTKEKVETISEWLLDQSLPIDELISFAEKQKDAAKATCIEAIEYATKLNPAIASESVLIFVTNTLAAKLPRIKWESAKVIGNIAHLFQDKLEKPIENLLNNIALEGTVVRWSVAYALSQILKLNTKYYNELLLSAAAICEKEEKKSIKKIYLEALKGRKIDS